MRVAGVIRRGLCTYCHAYSRCCRKAVSEEEPSSVSVVSKLGRNQVRSSRLRVIFSITQGAVSILSSQSLGKNSLAGLLLFFFSGCLFPTSSCDSIESARPAPAGESDMVLRIVRCLSRCSKSSSRRQIRTGGELLGGLLGAGIRSGLS